MNNSNLNLEEMINMVEKLCKKGQAYRRKRMAAGEKSSAYLSGRAVKVCKGQMQGENMDIQYKKGYKDFTSLVNKIVGEKDLESKRKLMHTLINVLPRTSREKRYKLKLGVNKMSPSKIDTFAYNILMRDSRMTSMEENKDDGAMKKSAKGMAMYGKKARMEDIEAEDDTEFSVSLKHLLKKHVSKGGEIDEGEDLDEIEMTIQEVFNMDIIDEDITEAKYKGKTVTLNKPMRGDSKKFKVYVNTGKKNADGSIKVKKVNFGHGGTTAKKLGQKTMKIRKSNPKRRKAFRARHRCDNPGPKTMARYWSCKKW